MTATERVSLYSDLIKSELKRISESRVRIAEWAYKLEQAAHEAVKEDT